MSKTPPERFGALSKGLDLLVQVKSHGGQ